MAPKLIREPFHRDGWVYEEKVDGWRILAYKDGARVRLVSRNGRDHTRRFAGIAAAVAKLAARALVLDGEVAIYASIRPEADRRRPRAVLLFRRNLRRLLDP